MLKIFIKKLILKNRNNILIDFNSDVNLNVINQTKESQYPCKIIHSDCSLTTVNEGCLISESKTYGDIHLGRFVSITGPGTVVKSLKEKISIGSFTSIGQNVCIFDFNHDFNRPSSNFINYNVFKKNFIDDITTYGPTIIEEDVWIGSNSLILPGITIGRGAVIGGGSVVTKDVPAYSIVVGNPAKIISRRFDESQISFLENLRWWNWDIDKIKKNNNFFNLNMKLCKLDDFEIF